MRYGFITYGNLRPEYQKKPFEEIHKMMQEVKKIADKYDIDVKMYGIPYGVSEDFVVVYESDKGLVNYYNFGLEANLPYANTRTNQVSIEQSQ